MNERFLWGCVNYTGSVQAGSGGFKVVPKGSTGIYTVVFDTSFSGMPAVVVTQRYGGTGWDDLATDGANVLDNAVLLAVTTDRFRVKTGNQGGTGEDRDFTFIVIGPA